MQQDNDNVNSDNTNSDVELAIEDFDFIKWKELHENDPEAFEQKRKNLLESTIDSAPQEYQQRLKGIMFQVDAARNKSNNPLQSCIAISDMMHKTLSDLHYFLNDLNFTLANQDVTQESEKTTASILEFKS